MLSDELAAMSLMAPKRVVLVREAEDATLPAIEGAITHRAPENFLILYATESLNAGSKLRLWAEKSAAIGAIACYKDEGVGLEQFISAALRGYGLRANAQVLRLLAYQLSGDRQIILNELEKLSLYVGDEAEEITMEAVIATVGENNDRSFDALLEVRAVNPYGLRRCCQSCIHLRGCGAAGLPLRRERHFGGIGHDLDRRLVFPRCQFGSEVAQ